MDSLIFKKIGVELGEQPPGEKIREEFISHRSGGYNRIAFSTAGLHSRCSQTLIHL